MFVEPTIETLPWEQQARADDPAYRSQIGRLLAQSRFYRKKLAEAGFEGAAAVGGLAAIAALPFTEKDELRATRSQAEPIGTHLAVPMTEVARIYSTSGTTGTPSYVPLTADDLADWARYERDERGRRRDTAFFAHTCRAEDCAPELSDEHDAWRWAGDAGALPDITPSTRWAATRLTAPTSPPAA